MNTEKAEVLSKIILSELSLHCEKCDEVGFIRRKENDSNNFSFLCIPNLHSEIVIKRDLFKETKEILHTRDKDFIYNIKNCKITKGNPKTSNQISLIYDNVIRLNVFCCKQENYGYQLALKTGPLNFTTFIYSRLKRLGYVCKHASIYKGTKLIQCTQEFDLFSLLNIQEINPENRFSFCLNNM